MHKTSLGRAVAKANGHLAFRGMFLHVWDLAQDGVENTMGWISEASLNTMCIAGNYHAGWFIHPHSARRRLFMTEGSVCYFWPQTSLYKGTRLKPRVSSLCRKHDWLEAAGKKLDRYNLRLVSWTIGTHNSRLGSEYPELTQQNVYGDRLPYALCPTNEEVAVYLEALCRDLAVNYPLWAIQLECFAWMSVRHGHHHERDLVGLNDFEAELLSLCLCSACKKKAAKTGLDVREVSRIVRDTLDDVFREAPSRSRNHPRSMAELEARQPALKAYSDWRQNYSRSIIKRIRNNSLGGTDCRLLLETGFDEELAGAVDGFATAAYQQPPENVFKICRSANRARPRTWNGLMQCFIQLGMGVPRTKDQLHGIVRAVRDGGCNGINFYNRSESPSKMLGWLPAVMKDFAE